MNDSDKATIGERRRDIDRYREIKAFADYVSQGCVERHMTQKEVTVLIAALVDHLTHYRTGAEFEQCLTEINDLVRGLRDVYAQDDEKPN